MRTPPSRAAAVAGRYRLVTNTNSRHIFREETFHHAKRPALLGGRGDSLEFWSQWKPTIIAIAKAHQAKVKAAKDGT